MIETLSPNELVEQLLTSTAAPTTLRVPGIGTLRRRHNTWWIRFTVNGERREESSKSSDQRVALKLLRKRVEEGKRRLNPVVEDKVTMASLFEALTQDYANNGRRSLATLGFRLAPLRGAFGQDRAREVTAARIAKYTAERLAEGKARATINRELAALRRAFRIAVDQDRISAAPRVRLMAENNVRQGFVTASELARIVAALPDYLQDPTRFAAITGWRKREIMTLEWTDVDLERRCITLRREKSKNGQPRTIPFVGEIGEIMARRHKVRGDSPYVFHRDGAPIKDFRHAWDTACTTVGKPGLLFHDLRRSAVRNLVSAGVDQSVAMKITGHKTIAVFQRYRIVADDDVRAALAKVAGGSCCG